MVKTAAEASRASLFDACLAESKTMEWPHNYYRLLFLGPLPHVLVCIGGVQSYAVGAKEKAKKRWSTASHQELEDIGKRRTELMYNFVLLAFHEVVLNIFLVVFFGTHSAYTKPCSLNRSCIGGGT